MKQPIIAGATALAALFPAAPAASNGWETTEQHRAAFAGATVRLSLGGRSAPVPEVRLGVGFSQYRRDGGDFLVSRDGPTLPIATGLSGGHLDLFVGGRSLAGLEREYRLGAGSSTVVLVIGALAAGAAAVVLLTDEGSEDGPCPPGVEVCAS